jgi:hypothetical protein
MGQAKTRGTFEQRKADAIEAGRVKIKRPKAKPHSGGQSPLEGFIAAITASLAARRARARRG